jgi:hypothetical protein
MSLFKLNPIKISSTGEHLPSDAPEWDAVYIPEIGRMFSADNVPGGELTEDEANVGCARLRLGGFNDWTQPDDRLELLISLDPVCAPFFRNVKRAWYRTNHAVEGSSGLVWVVSFGGGLVNYDSRDNRCWCRAVRSVSPASQ